MIRAFQKSDRPALENIVRQTWEYDRFCSPKIAAKMAKLYFNSCLINQTFTRVAEVDGMPVGIIMGKNIQRHPCPLSLRLACLASFISLFLNREGRKVFKVFAGVQEIDDALLASCKREYGGELAFFAIQKEYRGRGLGRKLFQTVVDYMQSQKVTAFYLFTDTTCNYPFYEHLGMQRCAEKKQTLHIQGQKMETTFFVYDYQIKPEECEQEPHM